MADDIDAPHAHHLLLQGQRHREQQFVVFTAVERRHDRVGIQFLRQGIGLPCDRNPVEVYAGPAFRRLANLHQVAGKPVRKVDHRRRYDALLGQCLHDVLSQTRLEILLQQVFVPCELRFGVFHVGKHPLLTLQQPQPHVRRTEVARNTDQVVLLCAAARHDLLLRGMSQRREAQHQSGHRSLRIAPHEVDPLLPACEGNSLVQLLQRLHRQLGRHTERHHQLRGQCVHRQDIACGHRHGLVSQVPEGEIGQVEVYALQQCVRRTEHRLAGRRHDDRRIVARGAERRSVRRVKPFGQQVYQAEFTQLGYFGASFLFHIINFFTKLRILYSFPKI